MFKWLHHLLDPHCSECQLQADRLSMPGCESCDTLRMQLAIVNAEKRQMLESILALTKPVEVQPPTQRVSPERAASAALPWNARRQLLEAEDRVKAQIIAKQKKDEAEAKKAVGPVSITHSDKPVNIDDRAQSIEQLEKELNINQEAANA